MSTRVSLLLVSALAAAASSAMLSQAAAAASPQTTKLLEIDTSFTGTGGFNIKGKAPPAARQGVLIGGKLYDLNGGKQGPLAGALHITCTFTNGAGADICIAVASLAAGKLVASGRIPGNTNKPFSIPFLGGSGAYAGAKGHVLVTPIGGPNSNKAYNTIVITG